MLLLRLALHSLITACALSAPTSLLRAPDSSSNDFDSLVTELDSEDSGPVLVGSSFANGLSSLLRSGVAETVEAGLAGTGPPRLPATRVTLNFGISVDVGELPEAGENGIPSPVSLSPFTDDMNGPDFVPFSIDNVGAAHEEAASTTPSNVTSLDSL